MLFSTLLQVSLIDLSTIDKFYCRMVHGECEIQTWSRT